MAESVKYPCVYRSRVACVTQLRHARGRKLGFRRVQRGDRRVWCGAPSGTRSNRTYRRIRLAPPTVQVSGCQGPDPGHERCRRGCGGGDAQSIRSSQSTTLSPEHPDYPIRSTRWTYTPGGRFLSYAQPWAGPISAAAYTPTSDLVGSPGAHGVQVRDLLSACTRVLKRWPTEHRGSTIVGSFSSPPGGLHRRLDRRGYPTDTARELTFLETRDRQLPSIGGPRTDAVDSSPSRTTN